jgi:hypothetical protein
MLGSEKKHSLFVELGWWYGLKHYSQSKTSVWGTTTFYNTYYNQPFNLGAGYGYRF